MQNEYPYIKNISIEQYRSHEKRICALLLIVSNVAQNVNLIVALQSALCGSILTVIALTLYKIDLDICALLLIISNVVQNVNLIVALQLAFCGIILTVIALTLNNINKGYVHCCSILCKMLIIFLDCTQHSVAVYLH